VNDSLEPQPWWRLVASAPVPADAPQDRGESGEHRGGDAPPTQRHIGRSGHGSASVLPFLVQDRRSGFTPR
jgi:hypothetical protein